MNCSNFSTTPRARILILTCMWLFVVLLVPGLGSHEDIEYWKTWSTFNSENGLQNAYLEWTDYPPLYHYILFFFGKLQGDPESIARNVSLLKALTFLFDLGALWLVYRWIEKKVDLLFLVLISVFNISFVYNSLLWGQIDGMLAFFTFFALYAAWEGKLILSFVIMVLALNFKLQGLMMVPLWLLLVFNSVIVNKTWKMLLLAIITGLTLQFLILLPFIQSEESRQALRRVLSEAFGRWPYTSANAFNIWYFVFDDPTVVKDTDSLFGSITVRLAGRISFFIFSALALIPVVQIVLTNLVKGRKVQVPREKLWLTGALIVLLFFFLNTEMHERYTHQAFLFIIAFSFYKRNYFSLVLFSLAYFLNLEYILKWLRLPNYGTIIFDPKFVATLYGICILFLFVQLFRGQRPSSSLVQQGGGDHDGNKV